MNTSHCFIINALFYFFRGAIIVVFINHYLLHEALISRDPDISAIFQFNTSINEFELSLKQMIQVYVFYILLVLYFFEYIYLVLVFYLDYLKSNVFL